MTQPIPYLKQGNNIVLVVNGEQYTVNTETHINYDKIVEALKSQDWQAVEMLIDTKKSIEDYSQGHVEIKNGEVYFDGELFNNGLTERLLDMYVEGFSIDPMIKFMENLMENPSRTSVEEFYTFMEQNSLPITDDGHFLAYKKVREDYKDIHSATFDNSVGQVLSMRRNQVDDNRHNTCSQGFHFCSLDYLPHFGSGARSTDRVMILKINPRDVVSIPSDYDNAKGRTCRYEVIGEYGIAAEVQHQEAFQSSVYNTGHDFGNGI